MGEAEPLLKNQKNAVKWRQIPFTRNTGVVLLVVLLLGAVYLLYTMIDKNEPSKVDAPANKARNPLHVSSVDTTSSDFFTQCAPRVKCDPYAKYRSVNGSCNNLRTPMWGTYMTPFLRMLGANFSDGFYGLRVQTNGSALPSARLVNIRLFLNRETYRVDANNVLLLPFGQLTAHDVSGLSNDVPRKSYERIIDCCADENVRKTFPQCELAIENPPDDPVYGKHNITCMGTLRSMTSRNHSCPLTPTTFINENTHFIDASEVYGSNDNVTSQLRAMVGGRLNFSTSGDGQMFCPLQQMPQNKPIQLSDVDIQYDTGDRNNGNQNLGITAIQTLFLRFHNYVAFQLSALNPSWPDETVYQESRRIVIGTIQRTVYEDFLPIVIGGDYQEQYGLNEENIYDPSVNPSTSQEFSSAAYRVLHTIIPVQFNFMNDNYEIESSMTVTDWLKRPNLLPVDNHFDKLFKGFLETPGRVTQPSYNYYISNFMFHLYYQPPYTGLDLLSVDIARGRDVGLQPYNQVRNFCGLPLANDFEHLADLIHVKDIKILKELYHSVHDIDLMVGLLLEKQSDDAIVGPTARCLIADGFYRYKVGDRFFYDVQGQPGSFTADQLKTIKKITLGHVICATSNVNRVHRDIFKIVDHNLFPTSKLKCDDEFNLDFNAWKQSNSWFEF